MTPSMFPNMDDSPKVNSMEKKSTAHTGEPGMCRMASAKMMKARPVPEALCNTHTRRLGHTHQRVVHMTHTCANTLPGLGVEAGSPAVWAVQGQDTEACEGKEPAPSDSL